MDVSPDGLPGLSDQPAASRSVPSRSRTLRRFRRWYRRTPTSQMVSTIVVLLVVVFVAIGSAVILLLN